MNTPRLQSVLRRTARSVLIAETLRCVCAAAAIVVGSTLIAIAVDALLGLTAAGLITLDLLLIALGAAAALYITDRLRRQRYNPRRIARLIETRLGLSDSRLINAVDFAESETAPASASLRQMAVESGEQAADEVTLERVIDRRPLKRALLAANGVVAVMLIAFLLMPGVFTMVVPRLFAPTADLPPFTLVEFDVSIEPQQVYHGKDATIYAKLGGPITPTSASVVFIEPDSTRRRAPMLRRDKGQFALPLSSLTESRTFYIDTSEGRSRRYTLEVLPVPLFEHASVELAYPDYTGWAAATQPLTEQGVRALIGTQATVTIESNLPLGDSTLVVHEADSDTQREHALQPVDGYPRQVRGAFEIGANGTFEITLRGRDGTQNDRTLTGPITAVTDAAPVVQMIEPDLRIVAPVGWKIPVKLSASDDVAVERITFQQRVNDDTPLVRDLTIEQRGPTYATADDTIDLDALGAEPGDVVRGFATAYDNHPDPAHSADSPAFEVQVISRSDYDEMARQQYRIQQIVEEMQAFTKAQRQLAEAREKLIEELEALKQKMAEQDGELSDEDREGLDSIRKQLDALEKQSRQLAEQMRKRAEQPQLYEFEEQVKKTLQQQADQLEQHADQQRDQREGLSGSPTPQQVDNALNMLRNQQQQQQAEQQQREMTQRQLELMALADRMMQQTERIVAIADRQRELAEKFAAYREKVSLTADDKARLEQLAWRQRDLADQLDEATRELSNAAELAEHELPTMAGSADQIVAKIRELKIAGDMRDAASHGELGRGAYASLSADKASRKLESLIGECSGMGQSAGNDLDGMLSLSRSQLQQCLNQMAQGRGGSRPGSGAGSGTGGTRGTGAGGQGTQAGGGAMNQPTLAGPHISTGGATADGLDSPESRSFSKAGDRGAGQGGQADGVQTIDPETRQRSTTGRGSVRGVPGAYRSLAEQYFRRLAEDSK